MRVLLIQSYLGRFEPPVAPLGLAVLASKIPRHEVKIFDPNIFSQPLPSTSQIINDFQPELIGISLRNIDTTKYSDQFYYYQYFRQYVKFIRKIFGSGALVVGGSGFSLFPHKIMSEAPEIDIGFALEDELSLQRFLLDSANMSEISGVYYREDGKIVATEGGDDLLTDDIISPAWDLVDLQPYIPYTQKSSIGVEAKRGCAFKCRYCTYPALSGFKVRFKEAQKVVDEIEYLAGKGVRRIFFCDPVFNYPSEHAESVCREIIERGLNMKWGGYHQEKYLTQEYVDLACWAGCDEFYFSPDAATSQGMRKLGKVSSPQSLNRSLDYIQSNSQARASYNFFAAVPHAGWRNVNGALKFIRRAKRKLGGRLLRYKYSYIRFEPGTPLVEELFPEKKNDSDWLLPANAGELKELFFRKSNSVLLNILLFIHFHLGKWFGRKNILKENVHRK